MNGRVRSNRTAPEFLDSSWTLKRMRTSSFHTLYILLSSNLFSQCYTRCTGKELQTGTGKYGCLCRYGFSLKERVRILFLLNTGTVKFHGASKNGYYCCMVHSFGKQRVRVFFQKVVTLNQCISNTNQSTVTTLALYRTNLAVKTIGRSGLRLTVRYITQL